MLFRVPGMARLEIMSERCPSVIVRFTIHCKWWTLKVLCCELHTAPSFPGTIGVDNPGHPRRCAMCGDLMPVAVIMLGLPSGGIPLADGERSLDLRLACRRIIYSDQRPRVCLVVTAVSSHRREHVYAYRTSNPARSP